MLRLDRVSKTYFRKGQAITALADVSLGVEAGTMVAVLGGKRAGKSTLLRVAAGLEPPDSGHVEFDGRRLGEFSDRELTHLRRTSIAMASRESLPPSRTSVLDVVALPLRLQTGDGRAALVQAERVLAAVEAEECRDAGIHELTDSERQLVAIAQALVTRPRLLLLDQPATSLEVAEERRLLGLFDSLSNEANVAILMTATQATEAMKSNIVVSLDRGQLRATGSVDGSGSRAEVVSIEERARERQTGAGDSSA